MTQVYSAVDATGMTRFPERRHPLWWGVLGLVVVEMTVVATLIVSYFYLKAGATEWPPASIEPPVLWPSINLVLLLSSAGTMYWAGWGINRNSQRILTLGTGLSVLLASIVLVLRSLEFMAYDFAWDSHPYGSIVWVMTGFHFVHVVSAIVGTAAVTWLAWRGYFTRERQLGVVVDTLYWYFVAGIWIPLYLVLYWEPRLL